MTQKSMLWATAEAGDGASAYTESELVRLFRLMFSIDPSKYGILRIDDPADGSPVNQPYSSKLEPSAASGNVTVAGGAALVNGYFYWNDDPVVIAIPASISGTTGHRIVLRANSTANTVRLVLLSSADGVSTIPAKTNTDGVTWDIDICSLTRLTTGEISATDLRKFLIFNSPFLIGRSGADEVWSTPAAVGGGLPFATGPAKMQLGREVVQLTAQASTTKNVGFTEAFSGAPMIMLTCDVGHLVHVLHDASTDLVEGFTIYAASNSGSPITQTSIVDWIAFGPA